MRLKVLNLVKKYNTNNPFKLAYKLGIEVIFEDLGETKGFFKKILKRKYIFINSELNSFEQRLVCSHELGHAILHSSKEFQFMIDNTRILRKSKIENEANEFASYLLFDDDEMIEDFVGEYEEVKRNKIDNWILEDIINIRKRGLNDRRN